MRQINRNPLGIRKLDVQTKRRAYRREARTEVRALLNSWDRYAREPLGLTTAQEVEVVRMLALAFCRGWEDGVTVGAQATRDRVAEALKTGTLVKPNRGGS